MDLHAPLGSGSRPRSSKPWLALAVAGATVACLVGFGAYFVGIADPHGGEPYAVAIIPAPPLPKQVPSPQPSLAPSAATTDQMPTGAIPSSHAREDDTIRVENGVKVISAVSADQAARHDRNPGPLVIDVSKALDGNARKSGGMVASSAHRLQPSMGSSDKTKPKVAIFVGGLGLGATQADTAIETLPAAVSLAFVPYQANIAMTVAAAKAKGHEILLQLPMQSAEGATPGPHALRTTEPRTELTADLGWLTSRFDGYAGITNLLGAPVSANAATMTVILKSVGARGAFYVDDGTSRRSLAPALGQNLGVPTVQADVVLDATNDPAVVDANLERLAKVARTKGSAIGMASGLSDHLGAVARFASQLDARGFALVPVGEIARDRVGLAASR